jgi:DNA-binding PadR family transcriptional regulator
LDPSYRSYLSHPSYGIALDSAPYPTGRQVREYRLTPAGRKQLDAERANYRRVSRAIAAVLESA